MFYISAACGCETGKIRRNNEDNFYFDGHILPQENQGTPEILVCEKAARERPCFGVFDGMGGEAFGEESSFLAADTLALAAGSGLSQLEICQKANERICEKAREHDQGAMGTTAVTLAFRKRSVSLLNIGDSKAFLYRKGALEQISVDHITEVMLNIRGQVHRKVHLTQHLGIEPEELTIMPYTTEIGLKRGDKFLLCSDGLTDMVDRDDICSVLNRDESPKESVARLLSMAMEKGGKDNTTVLLCQVYSKWR